MADYRELTDGLRARLQLEKWFGVSHLPTSAGDVPRLDTREGQQIAAPATQRACEPFAGTTRPKPSPDEAPPAAPARASDARGQKPSREERAAPQRGPKTAEKLKKLAELEKLVRECARCALHKTRRNTVFGEGNPDAEIMFIGEAPGYEEDVQARPFVGRAGQLLTRIIEAMGLHREDVYIANILKCRPPDNRTPYLTEIVCCGRYVLQQARSIQPKIIVALGNIAVRTLLNTDQPISLLRGKFHDFQGITLMPTYHTAFLLRNPASKAEVWEDMKKVLAELGKRIPASDGQ